MNKRIVALSAGILCLTASCLTMSACATSGSNPSPTAGPAAGPSGTTIPATGASTTQPRSTQWAVKTREHVDLWLHGFGMVQPDSTVIPYFRRGYRDDMVVQKNKANVLTQLDVNVEKLQARLRENPALINAQFIPLYFPSLDVMQALITRFVEAGGNPRAATSQQESNAFSLLGGYFSTPADRAWLALFSSGLWDEQTKFYHSYWIQQQRARTNIVDSVQATWVALRPRLQRFLNNTQQANGEIFLSLPLDGEGRTLNVGGSAPASIAVTFPDRPADALHSIYVLAHELIAPVAMSAIQDNTTPAQQRSGDADQIMSAAAVRGGLLLLEAVAPELATGYATYYVNATGRTPNSNPRAQLATLFPIPDPILGAMTRQLETVQGGI